MTDHPPITRPENELPTDASQVITSHPPASLEHAPEIPRAAPLPGAFEEPQWLKTAALVGRLSFELRTYHGEFREDREAFRDWLSNDRAQRDQEWRLLRGWFQRIEQRLQDGDDRFGRIEQENADLKIFVSMLVDSVSALTLALHKSERLSAKPGLLDGMLVLILEDDANLRGAVAGICEENGARTITAASIEQAAAILVSGAPLPDVVTVDLRLAHGQDAMPFVRELRSKHPVRVIILTGRITPEQAIEARMLGIRVIPKPFTIEQLIGAVRVSSPEE